MGGIGAIPSRFASGQALTRGYTCPAELREEDYLTATISLREEKRIWRAKTPSRKEGGTISLRLCALARVKNKKSRGGGRSRLPQSCGTGSKVGKPQRVRRGGQADRFFLFTSLGERRDGALAKMTSFLFLFYPKT